jgi:hypothetical protein
MILEPRALGPKHHGRRVARRRLTKKLRSALSRIEQLVEHPAVARRTSHHEPTISNGIPDIVDNLRRVQNVVCSCGPTLSFKRGELPRPNQYELA